MQLAYIEPVASLTIGLSLRGTIMTGDEIADCYRGYIACLNGRRWAELERFVHDEVHYNGQFVGLDGYRQMLDGDVRAIPDLQFNIGLLIVEPPHVAAQLRFDCIFSLRHTPRRLNGFRWRDTEVAQAPALFADIGSTTRSIGCPACLTTA